MSSPTKRSRRAEWLALLLLLMLLGAAALATAISTVAPAQADPRQSTIGYPPPIEPQAGGVEPSERAVRNSSGMITRFTGGSEQIRWGSQLYADHCSSCHGDHLQGSINAPPLLNAGAAAVDFYLQTGRMPQADPGAQMVHQESHFTPQQVAAIVAFVAAHSHGPPLPTIHMGSDLMRGRQLYADNCEPCHGVSGQGFIVAFGWNAASLRDTPVEQVAEAVRIGPGVMPRFSPKEISDSDLDDIIRWINTLQTNAPQPGGLALRNFGPVPEGIIAGIFGIGGLMVFIYFIGSTAPEPP